MKQRQECSKKTKQHLTDFTQNALSRRNFLRGGSALAVNALLQGCGGTDTQSNATLSTSNLSGLVNAKNFANNAVLQSAMSGVITDTMNQTFIENTNIGTLKWITTNPAPSHEIEGYASATTIGIKESLTVFVSTIASSYTYEIYRMGYYGGMGGRLLGTKSGLTGTNQTSLTTFDTEFNAPNCTSWKPSFSITIPDTWVSGVYLIKLTMENAGSYARYVPFIVRSEKPTAVLVPLATATYQAYNNWGINAPFASKTSTVTDCYSLYDQFACDLTNINGDKLSFANTHVNSVSFNRPLLSGWGTGDILSYTLPFIAWLESNGYDVSYCDSLDLHSGMTVTSHFGVVLSLAHDEYFSFEMRQQYENAIGSGTSAFFWGANPMYWQVRMGGDQISFNTNRNMVCYKMLSLVAPPTAGVCGSPSNVTGVDPWYQQYQQNGNTDIGSRITARWRDPILGKPEQNVVGQMYIEWIQDFNLYDWYPTTTSHWTFTNSGVSTTVPVKGIIGCEFDGVYPVGKTDWMAGSKPLNITKIPNLVTLASSKVNTWGTANSTIYQAGAAWVFSAGTITWGWGLSDLYFPHLAAGITANKGISSPVIQRMSANLLDTAISGTLPGGARIGVLHSNGDAFVSEGRLLSYMHPVGQKIKKLLVNGDRIGMLDNAGNVWVRNGIHGTPWVLMSTAGATDFALDGVRVGILYSNQNLYICEGELDPKTAQWVSSSVTNFAMNKNIIAAIQNTNNGSLYVKSGTIGTAWTLMSTGISKVTISDSGRLGTLSINGDAAVCDGTANSNAIWNTVSYGIVDIRLAGNRIGVLKAGELYVKDGAYDASWTLESTNVQGFDLCEARIGVCKADGSTFVKDGSLDAGWTNISLNGNSISLGKTYATN